MSDAELALLRDIATGGGSTGVLLLVLAKLVHTWMRRLESKVDRAIAMLVGTDEKPGIIAEHRETRRRVATLQRERERHSAG